MPHLPPPGDPMVDRHGNLYKPDSREGSEPASVALTIPDAAKYIAKKRRAIQELPSDQQTQTIIHVVLLYHLFGLTSNEIAHIINADIEAVENVKALPAFQETFELLFRELISINSNSLQARIQSYASRAAQNMMDLANYEPQFDDEGNLKGYIVPAIVKQKANADILDRAGLSSEALFGRDAQEEDNALQVVIVNEGDTRSKIDINLTTPRRR